VSTLYIGLLNGILTLTVWTTVMLSLASFNFRILPILLAILIPVSILVSYRTIVLAKLMQQGKATIKLYSFDGFKWAFIASCIVWAINISSQVLAAGDPLQGASGWQVFEYILTIAIPTSLFVGLLGGVHGVLFYYVSLWQITANK
jgi:hypothetical protein